MNKIRKIIFTVIIALCLVYIRDQGEVCIAQDTSSKNDFIINKNIVVGYTGSGGDVFIPEGVISIGNSAFSEHMEITNITLPSTVTSIGICAFQNCVNLKSVHMSNNVTTINYGAFDGCINLKEIASMEGVLSIGSIAFYKTQWLEEKKNENPLVVVNGILIDASACIGSIVIPDSVTSIVEYAFKESRVTTITIPNSIEVIESNAFSGCIFLETVKIADSVWMIKQKAFAYCENLKNVQLPNSLNIIREQAFYKCSKLEKITIPDSVYLMEANIFRRCINLKLITVMSKTPEKPMQISPNAFKDTFSEITIYGMNGSNIQKYSNNEKITFKELELVTKNKTMNLGDTFTLQMNSLADCIWRSTNNSVTTVDSDGNVTAKKAGQSTIIANLYGKEY